MNYSESSEEEEEEEFNLEYWNNWCPPAYQCSKNEINLRKKTLTKNFVFSSNVKHTQVRSIEDNAKFGNWIPPSSFSFKHLDCKRSAEQENKEKRVTKNTFSDENIASNPQTLELTVSTQESNNSLKDLKWRKILNADWGKRVELHDVSGIADGSLIWGMVSSGLFAHIKLWVNEYGNICGSADGTISKIGSSEITYISITNAQLLKKMLNVSSSQWTLLCELVQRTKASLKFEALKNSDMTMKNSLEKLWFFLCKRRHFCSEQCMLVKICGAVKCLREFRITPKLIVQDIRSAPGYSIS